MKYDLSKIAIAPNGEPIKHDNKPATMGVLLEFLLSTAQPPPATKLEVYRLMQLVSGANENGEHWREITAERVTLLKQLAIDSQVLATVAVGVLHDWLEQTDAPRS